MSDLFAANLFAACSSGVSKKERGKRVNEVVSLAVKETSWSQVAASINTVIEAADEDLPVSRVLFLVDSLLQRCREIADVLAPYAVHWLSRFVCQPSHVSIIRRWHSRGVLTDKDLNMLLRLVEVSGRETLRRSSRIASMSARLDADSAREMLRPGIELPSGPCTSRDRLVGRDALKSRKTISSPTRAVPSDVAQTKTAPSSASPVVTERPLESPSTRRTGVSREMLPETPLARDKEEAVSHGEATSRVASRDFETPKKRKRLGPESQVVAELFPQSTVSQPGLETPSPSSQHLITCGVEVAPDTAEPHAKRRLCPCAANKAASHTDSGGTKSRGDVVEDYLPQIHKVLGDGRCMFRAVCRAVYDPLHKVKRNAGGEPLEESCCVRERSLADSLRAKLCTLMRERAAEVAELLADSASVGVYIASIEEPCAWGDAICLRFLPDLARRPIQVYAHNWEEQRLFDAGMYLPRDTSKHSSPSIFLWYDGKIHYDLVSPCWLRMRERMLCSESLDNARKTSLK